MKSIYLIGSLRNAEVVKIENELRQNGYEVFAEWWGAGPEADDYFRKYNIARGKSYIESLETYGAKHIFNFDKFHIDRCDIGVLLCPAGKSGHLELGYMLGKGKPGFILLEPQNERWDLMYQFATGVCENIEELIAKITSA